MSSTGKLSGAQRRKRKAKAAEEARKSSKLLAAFLKVDKEAEHDDLGSKSANEESEAKRMESEVTSDNINDSDETSDESEVVAEQEDPKPGPSQQIYHNNPIITFGDIGFMSFTAAARPCIDDATKELLNLALRGHVEQLDSDNPGNFLATLKFLSFYDTLLENHLKNVFMPRWIPQSSLSLELFRKFTVSFWINYTLEEMSEMLDLTVKKESDTRWSAREAAVRAIAVSYGKLVGLLQSLNEDQHESTDTRAKAGILLKSLLTFNYVVYLYFWNKVLHKINVVQKRLQSPNMNLHEAATDLDSLWKNFTDDRDNLCARSLQQGLQLADKWEIATERRMRRKRLMPGRVNLMQASVCRRGQQSDEAFPRHPLPGTAREKHTATGTELQVWLPVECAVSNQWGCGVRSCASVSVIG
eukprot:Em0934g1a